MSTFYLLPPRPLLADQIADYLKGLFPGLTWDTADRLDFVESLTAAATRQPGVYVVFREELPDGEPARQALVDGFGAEDGDDVIELRPGPRPGELVARRWPVRAAA